jgi:lactate dehydrogenase-like 2-hydroxyacid dehydrogenase
MSKQTVFVTRAFPGSGISLLKKAGFAVEVYEKDQIIPRRELLKRIKGKDAVLSLLTDRVNEEFFAAAGPQLKIVANYAVGFDNIDLTAAKNRKVAVTNAPGDLISDSVAEHTFALMLAVTKRIVESDRYARTGKYQGWSPTLFLGMMLKGKTFAIIGSGRIGVETARRAAAMGMKIIYTDIKRNTGFEQDLGAKFMKQDALLKAADVVSLHVPLLPGTRHLISTKELKMMKKTAYLINTARGPVVDEKALNLALEKGEIAGAAIDVYECEPAIDCDLSDTHELRRLENVVLTPHTASAAIEARSQMGEMAAKNVIAVLKGKKAINPAG